MADIAARLGAGHRRRRRDQLRTLSIALAIVVAVAAAASEPGLGLTGAALPLTFAVLVYCGALLWSLAAPRDEHGRPAPGTLPVLAVAGVAIAWLQRSGSADVAAAAAVWTLAAIVPDRWALVLAAVVAVATAAADAVVRGDAVADGLGTVLLCAVLGATGLFMRRAAEAELRTAVLLGRLEAARDAEAAAAAAQERGRIAGELHDVLAHALSGAAIQLEGARVLAEREDATPRLRDAVGRAGELVRDGLCNAREAVGALRGGAGPAVADLERLAAAARRDLGVAVEFATAGAGPEPSGAAALALYRGVQEALTNAARHAPGAAVAIRVAREPTGVRVTITDTPPAATPAAPPVPVGAAAPAVPAITVTAPADRLARAGDGGGHGLAGMRERLTAAGGHAEAGPVPGGGWRVRLEVPA